MKLSFKQAVAWIASNDDTEWLSDPNGHISVTGALVCDIYGVSEGQFRLTLRQELARLARQQTKS